MGLWTAILGDPGAGKTNLLAALGYQELREGIRERVVATFHLHYPANIDRGRTSFMSFPNLVDSITSTTDPKKSPCYRALLLIDEISENADSYHFLSGDAINLSKLVSQFRKFEAYGYYTDQLYSKVPAMLRRQTGGFVLIADKDSWDAKRHPPYAYNCAGLFQCDFYDGDQKFLRRRVFDGRATRDFYDTTEIVQGRDRIEAAKVKKLPSSPKRSKKGLTLLSENETIDPTSEQDEIFTK